MASNPPIATQSPVQKAKHESLDRINAARDKIIEALSHLHPEEQLDAAQATLNAL